MAKQPFGRGFSVNREVSDDNLSQKGLVALRVVYDHIKPAGGSLKVKIEKSLVVACKTSNDHYKAYLKQRQEKCNWREEKSMGKWEGSNNEEEADVDGADQRTGG